MSSNDEESNVSGKDNIPNGNEPLVASRAACDSKSDNTLITKELSTDHARASDKSCSEEEAFEYKTPSQNHESLPDVAKSSQEVCNSIKSPSIDASHTNESKVAEKSPDSGDVKSSSPDDSDEWVDILGTGHLKKKVIREGQSDYKPTPSCQVTIRTKGQLEDSGKLVDINERITFAAGEGDVVQAWDLLVSLMCKGEICLVKTTARFAYGSYGRSPDVPPNAGILYELELLEVDEPIDTAMLTEVEMLNLVDAKCNRGNWLFQRREYFQAVSSYEKGNNFIKQYLERQEEDAYVMTDAVRNMTIRCLNNLAATQLKTSAYNECVESCEKVLALDKDNVKAHFRYGKVMLRKGESASAVQHLRRALELSPNEKVIQTELQEAVKLHEANRKKEKDLYKKMVQGLQKDISKSDTKHHLTQWPWGTYAIAAVVVAAIGVGIFYFFQSHRQ